MKFSGQSDRTVVISLPSAITEIFWHEKEGFVNGAVTFEVRTAYVYWGAPIKILLKNKEGKTIKNFDDGKVFELHRRIIALGPEAAGGVFCEVELPEHKLKVQSPLLKVPGAIRVKSVTWKDKESGKTLSEVTRDQETLLEAKVEGGSPESKAFFTVFEKRGEHVHRLIDLPAKVEQGAMSVTWVFTHSAPTDSTYSSQSAREPTAENYQPPAFFIEATIAGAKLKSGEIPLQDATVVEVVDENGIPQSEREVTVVLPDGSERKEVTDELGKVYLGNIPPGEIRFILGPPVAKKAAAGEEGGEGKPEGKKQEGKAGQGVAPKPGGGMGDVKMAEREEKGIGNEKPKGPPWLEIAEKEAARWKGKGEDEISKTINYHQEVGFNLKSLSGTDHAWCASFVNYCLKQTGYSMSSPACRARSFADDSNFVKIEEPVFGAIAMVDTRHVGFLYAKDASSGRPILLGGNQSDQINFTAFKSKVTYYLPKQYAISNIEIFPVDASTTQSLNVKFGIGAAKKVGDDTR